MTRFADHPGEFYLVCFAFPCCLCLFAFLCQLHGCPYWYLPVLNIGQWPSWWIRTWEALPHTNGESSSSSSLSLGYSLVAAGKIYLCVCLSPHTIIHSQPLWAGIWSVYLYSFMTKRIISVVPVVWGYWPLLHHSDAACKLLISKGLNLPIFIPQSYLPTYLLCSKRRLTSRHWSSNTSPLTGSLFFLFMSRSRTTPSPGRDLDTCNGMEFCRMPETNPRGITYRWGSNQR